MSRIVFSWPTVTLKIVMKNNIAAPAESVDLKPVKPVLQS